MELKYRGAANGVPDAQNSDTDGVCEPKILFKEIHKKALSMGIPQHELYRLQFSKNFTQSTWTQLLCHILAIFLAMVALLAACWVSWTLDWPVSKHVIAQVIMLIQGKDVTRAAWKKCLIESSDNIAQMFRPISQCDFCRHVSEIVRVPHISASEFEDKYAYSGHPVVISDGAANWSAVGVFNFEFFRDIYEPGSPVLVSRCQFFRYQFHEASSVLDVFLMYENGEHFKNGSNPIYFGWENCDVTAGSILRKHYSRPYFLPPHSESAQSDWVFMGSPGYGASLHIDNIGYPSWQAQISGHKKWILQSPPECLLVCPSELTVTVHPGEIIVLDTNMWYHSTFIVGDDISITIGSEYD